MNTANQSKRQTPQEDEAQMRQEELMLQGRMGDIDHKLLVLSGKGGVGKSTVAANLAVSLAQAGKRVGLLDVHGPSIPKLMGLEGRPVQVAGEELLPVKVGDNLSVMSIGFLISSGKDPVIWLGPRKCHLIRQLSKRVSNGAHPNCVVSGPVNQFGLQLEFTVSEDGGVQAAFDCSKTFQGYAGLIHGGVISSLLDGAMTNCLFAHGRQEMITGELKVRFRHPIVTNRPATVRAWIDRSTPPLHMLQAELIQDESVKAKATGKFMERSHFETKRMQV